MVAQLLRVRTLAVCTRLALASLAACGVRNPLGDVAAGVEAVPFEAGDDGGTPSGKAAAPGAGGDAGAALTCAGRLAACEADSACVSILNCVLLDCATAGASAQMTCAFGCSAGNLNELTTMLPLFNCLKADGGAPGGLGGLLAGAGGSGGLGALGALLDRFGGGPGTGGSGGGSAASGSSSGG